MIYLLYGDNMDSNLINRYKDIVISIKNKYNYDNNITHLLYIIIPAFIYYYKYNEKMIIDIFNNIEIITNDKELEYVKAYYSSIPKYSGNDIVTSKYIVINDYNQINLVNLFDCLVHEFNHAINSYNKEILIRNNILYLRTGITYNSYNIFDFTPLNKDKSYILEEIINTRQTETIINIIKECNIDDEFLNNIIYALNSETSINYESNAYYLENKILNKLLTNKTFISTIDNLRITGDIEDINNWFDNITGINNSYNKLIDILNDIINLELKYDKAKYFKNRILSKIKSKIKDIEYIINIFNNNCNYK